MTPIRIQRRRTKDWRKPEGAKYVGRGTPFGNPWAVVRTNTGTGWAVQWAGHANQHRPLGLNDFIPANDRRDAHALAVELFEVWVHAHPTLLDRIRRDLVGRDLMCWCVKSLPCHVDVLLQIGNTTPCGPTPDQCDAASGEPCADHEWEQAHADGEYCFCGPECPTP